MAPPQTPTPPASGPGAKTALRDQLLTVRHRRSLAELGTCARDLAGHLLAAPEVRRAATVAAYVSLGSEPGTGALIEALRTGGTQVLLPLLQPDNDLDWGWYTGPDTLRHAGRGLLEPVGVPLGPEAVAMADVVLLPGLAVSADGWRLGRGGGSYDRALARVPGGTFTCVLLDDDEVGVPVPVDPHDCRVRAAASPSGIRRLGPGPA